MNPTRETFEMQQWYDSNNDNEIIPKSASASLDGDGWLFRPPENGHVITRGEMVSRIVQYYEVVNSKLKYYYC